MKLFALKICLFVFSFSLILILFHSNFVSAETPFIESIAGKVSPSDYHKLISFDTPMGSGTNRKTIIKLVTDTLLADITFRIEPQSVGETGNNRLPVDVQVLGTGGPHAIPKDLQEDDPLSTVVASTIMAQEVSESVASGHSMVRVTIEYDDGYTFPAATGETWHLKVMETTADQSYFGFAGSSEAEVTKAKIEAMEELDFGEVQKNVSTGVAPVRPVDIRNIGTAPLLISGAPISNNPQPIFFEVTVFVVTSLNPGEELENIFDEDASDGTTEKKGLWVMAHPSILGERPPSTLTIQSNDDPVDLILRAKGVSLYAHILVDTSTSMGAFPDGTYPAPENDSRLTDAKEAGREINNWVKEFSDGQAFIGLSIFPDSFSSADSAVVVPIDRTINNHPSIQVAFGPESLNGLKAVQPTTPMESGILVAIGDMDARINSPNPPSPAERPDLRQALLLLSDGRENETSSSASQIGQMNDKGIRAYTIGYGVPDKSYVDHTTLQDLATGTGGEFFDANSLDAFALKDAFKGAVTPWLGLRPVSDPRGTIRRGQTKSHTVCLDETAYGVTFSVDWDRHAAGGVELVLTSPTGETITPSSLDVSYYSSNTFAMYVIRGKRLRGGQGAGEWTLSLSGGDSIPNNNDTQYSYNVLVQSPVLTEPQFPKATLLTGMQFLMEMQLAGVCAERLKGLTVTLDYDLPAESFGTYLAKNRIDPSWVFEKLLNKDLAQRPLISEANAQERAKHKRVPDTIMGEPATLVQKKAYALANFSDKPFTNKRSKETIQLYDDGTHGDKKANDGIFSNQMPKLAYEGVHNFYIKVNELKPKRKGCVNREIKVAKYVDIMLSSELISKNVQWAELAPSLFFDPSVWEKVSGPAHEGYERRAVIYTMQDALGNYGGPGLGRKIKFTTKSAELIGPVVDNWDGSYIQVIQYKKGDVPSVTVSARGITTSAIPMPSEEKLPIVPPFVWVLLVLVLIAVVVFLILRKPRSA